MVQGIEKLVDILAGNYEGWQQAQDCIMGDIGDDSAHQQSVNQVLGGSSHFGADHQSHPSNLSDAGVMGCQISNALDKVCSKICNSCEQSFLLDDRKHLQGKPAGERAASEG